MHKPPAASAFSTRSEGNGPPSPAASHPLISPSGPPVGPLKAPAGMSPTPLERRVQDRISKRLGRRIRDLRVQVVGNRVTLSGRCATYYSKQLAQHAALGVIEDEVLENEIEVCGVL